jgi:hypothetical protein
MKLPFYALQIPSRVFFVETLYKFGLLSLCVVIEHEDQSLRTSTLSLHKLYMVLIVRPEMRPRSA